MIGVLEVNSYITFEDITDLYMRYGRGRTLTIVTDCHSSGNWVNRGKTFLRSHGIPVCGHLAKEKEILLRIYASCRTGQDAMIYGISHEASISKTAVWMHYL